ncbi:hypothetical protein [Saccharicrinis sp. GN24d3]|uniref:hypothetical protein n=1 Tax=Saccharicrinis sp. GN24d3 TaxID=3458416 RepID=UPI004035E79F
MKSENINKSLVEIQQSLTKIDSARVQVEKVAETGTMLSSATKDLAQEVKKMADVIKNETSSVLHSFSVSLADFEQKMHDSIDNGDQSIGQKVKTFKETAKKIEETTKSELKNVNNQSAELIKKYETDLANKLDAVIINLNGKFIDFESSIADVARESQKGIAENIQGFNKAVGKLTEISHNTINEAKSLASETAKNQEVQIATAIETIGASFSNKLVAFEDKIGSETENNKNVITEKIEDFTNSTIKLKEISHNAIHELRSLTSETITNQEAQITAAIETIIVNFSDKLVQFESRIGNITKENTNCISKEIQDFNTSINELKSDNNKSINGIKEIAIESIEKQTTQAEHIIKTLIAYSDKIQRLVQQLSIINFSNELEKLNNSIAKTNNETHHIQQKIQNMEKSISETLSKTSEMQEKIFIKQRNNTYITWALIVLSTSGFFVLSNYKFFLSLF